MILVMIPSTYCTQDSLMKLSTQTSTLAAELSSIVSFCPLTASRNYVLIYWCITHHLHCYQVPSRKLFPLLVVCLIVQEFSICPIDFAWVAWEKLRCSSTSFSTFVASSSYMEESQAESNKDLRKRPAQSLPYDQTPSRPRCFISGQVQTFEIGDLSKLA